MTFCFVSPKNTSVHVNIYERTLGNEKKKKLKRVKIHLRTPAELVNIYGEMIIFHAED